MLKKGDKVVHPDWSDRVWNVEDVYDDGLALLEYNDVRLISTTKKLEIQVTK